MPFAPRAASPSNFRTDCRQADHSIPLTAFLLALRLRRRALALAWVVLSLCTAGQGQIVINGDLPISNPTNGAVYLSGPEVEQTNECSVRVKVTSFIPGAAINVYLTATSSGPVSPKKLIGGPVALPADGMAVKLTQSLKYGDQVKATQTVNGSTSALSAVPMITGSMLTSLPKPTVDGKNMYACGVIVPVYNLVPGVKVEVFDKTAGGPSPIGTDTVPDDWGSNWDPVLTSQLDAPPKTAAHEIHAKQTACNGADSGFGPALPVQAQPSSVPEPGVVSAIKGNPAITLDKLLTGAIVQIFDHNTSTPLNGPSAATGDTNWFLLPTPLSASAKVLPQQTLCQPSTGTKTWTPTNSIPAPLLLSPICPGQSAAFVRNSTVNAALVLLKGSLPEGYGGAALGDVPLDIAPPAVFANGDKIQVAEYFTNSGSPPVVKSNTVIVGEGCIVHTRQDVAKLSAAQIASLKKGILVMMERSYVNPDDPTGFTYQANMHSTVMGSGMCPMGDSSNPLWDQCQHASDFFFPWHRMYLYYFERILRAASGDPNLALPYWNYESSSEQTLPADFMMPALPCTQVTEPVSGDYVFALGDPGSHPGCNPLYVADRAMNGGKALFSGSATMPAAASDSTAMMDTTFEASFGGNFGGGPPPPPPPGNPPGCHFNGNNFGDLESQPHNVIHCQVGGIMCDVNQSGNDPIFYLHHTEIDHLWKVWLAQGGGRANPTSDTAWMNTSFNFYDETGTLVTLSFKDALDTVTQLDYRYDDDPPVKQMMARPAPRMEERQQLPSTPPEELAVSSQTGIGLGSEASSAQIKIPPETAAKIKHLLEDKQFLHAIALNLEIDHVKDSSGVYYEIYANLPANEKPVEDSIYYVGNLGLFLPRNSTTTIKFDLTRSIRAMNDKKAWDGSQLTITFVPRGLIDSKTRQPLPLPPGVRATIERVSLLAK
jgi:Common central domain of tyrosinase/Polyphenol oxidase middle domain